MTNDHSPINKENLAGVVAKLKQVLNPTITLEYYDGVGIKLITDIPSSNTDVVSFSVKSLAHDSSEDKTIYCIGYLYNDENNKYCATNLGSRLITKVGSFIEDDKLVLLLVPDPDYSYELLKTEAEVFVADNNDNKNHVTDIVYLTETEYDYYTDNNALFEIEGDLDVNFYYSVRTGANTYEYIQNGGNGNIESIYHSDNADELTHDINLTVVGTDSNDNEVITGSIDLLTETNAENVLNLTVDTDAIVEAVKDDFTLDPATTENLGGIRLADPQSLLSNLFPVQLNQNTSAAYVDLTDFNPDVTADIHRFATMPADASVAGTFLVQYIGTTTGDYTFGYYYQWAPTEFNVTSESDGWREICDGGQGVAGTKIASYNRDYDYILKVNTPIVITLIDTLTDLVDPIQDETLFNITQGDTFSEDLTYGDIKTKIGFELSSGFITYDSTKDYDLTLSLTTSASAWRQKNVLPMVKVGSPLVFKGTKTAATGETDIEALERQVSDPEIGDFYIVLPSEQEYFYTGNTGSEWEYVGKIIDLNYVSQEAPGTLSVQVGGIANNTPVEDITNKPVSEVLDMILFPDIEPTLSGSQKFTFDTSQAKTVAYGSDAYATSVFSTSHSEQTVSYSKQNNTGSVLKNQTYQGEFTVSEITKLPNINKFTSNVTYYCTGTWANGDKYPCTKKGNTPASGSPSGAYVSQSSEKTVKINVLKHCLYGVADTINATSIEQGTKLFRSSTGSFDITLDHPVGGRHFIAVPAVSGQNWTIGDIKLGVLDVTNSFTKETVQNVTVTNNGETYTMDMHVAYLTNPAAAADSVTYNITIS